MKTRPWLGLVLLLLVGCRAGAQTPAANPLDAYIAKPEPAYAWALAPDGMYAAAASEVNLSLTSQTWQGMEWKHRVQIIVPQPTADTPVLADAAVIWVTANGNPGETLLAQSMARATGALAVNLFNVPNQPLFGKSEDALIAHSFAKYMETSDSSWPLLYPMAKSVVKAMDAVSEWSEKTRGTPVKRFIIFGASKRGWTTFLAAESDKRVVGIVPIVYNFLNVPAQLAYQRKIWGKTSDQMGDYDALMGKDDDPQGQAMLAGVDPYSLRARLTMPKLLVMATNDRYWPPEALQFYGADLPKPLSLFFAPNAPHGLQNAYVPVMFAAAGWARRVLSGTAIPELSLSSKVGEAGTEFSLKVSGTEEDIRAAKLWYATTPTPDRRAAKWQAVGMEGEKDTFKAQLAVPGEGTTAVFAEVEIGDPRLPLKLSTGLWTGP